MKCYKDTRTVKVGEEWAISSPKRHVIIIAEKKHKDRLSSSPANSTGRLVGIPIMGSQSFAWRSKKLRRLNLHYGLSSTSNADHHHTKKNSRPQSQQ